jgi:hypothetical protein
VTINGLRARFLENAVVKESTSAAFRQTTDRLREHFGRAASIATLGEAQAKSLREEITVLELKYFGPHGASDSLDASSEELHPELSAVVER